MDFLKGLAQFAGAYGQQDQAYRQNQHMNKVFAANPQFAQQLYSAQNEQKKLGMLEEEQRLEREKRLRKQSALARLSEAISTGTPAQSALAQYAVEAEDASALLNQLGAGQNTPAAIQIANEIQKRRQAGDEAGAQLLESAAKIYDKGVQYDPSTGQYTDMGGYAGALGSLSYGRKSGENQSDLQYKPTIAQQTARQTEIGKREGEAAASLQFNEANLPKLEKTVVELSELGKKATYTIAGKVADSTRRQLGVPVGDGAEARKEYIAKVDNEILPLLRDTFGAQFTEREGETLRKTLGDVDASPEEKDAVLRAFIKQKREQIDVLRQQTGIGGIDAKRKRLEELRRKAGR